MILAWHDRLCKPLERYSTVRLRFRHVVTIGFPEVTYSLGLGELTETLCLIPILICFRLVEQLSKLIVRWIFSKDRSYPLQDVRMELRLYFILFGWLIGNSDLRTRIVVYDIHSK